MSNVTNTRAHDLTGSLEHRLLELVELNAERGRGTYVEPGSGTNVSGCRWIVGWTRGMGGYDSGFGDTLIQAVTEALDEANEA